MIMASNEERFMLVYMYIFKSCTFVFPKNLIEIEILWWRGDIDYPS